jgi:hypothetical protein
VVSCTFTGAKAESAEIIPSRIEDGANMNESGIQTIYGEITQIGIYYDTDYTGIESNPVQITDSKIISDIMDMISQSKVFPDDQLNKMRPMTKGNSKLILTLKDGSKNEFMFAYDDLYQRGYVQIEEALYRSRL